VENLIPIEMLARQVIIIDDEKDFCKLLENYFLKKKYKVEVYYLLNEGLKALEKHSSGILFLDNNLPDGLGWQKFAELREIYPGLKLHLLSGYNYIRTAIPGNDHVKYWHKPINFTDLDEYFR